MVEFVFDTFAWLEELGGGRHAHEVHALHVQHDVGTPDIVIAELAHVYARKAPDAWPLAIEAVRSTSRTLAVTPEIAERAGALRAVLEKNRRGIGLVDCLILETARAHGGILLTGDPHLVGLDGVRALGRP